MPTCFYADKEDFQIKIRQRCGGDVLFQVKGHFQNPIYFCYQHKKWWNRTFTDCPICVARKIVDPPP